MLGAIIGDIAGSTFEFRNTHNYDFSLFAKGSSYTDDSICSVAVAEWLLDDSDLSPSVLEQKLVDLATLYPNPMGGYGGGFRMWLFHPECLRVYSGSNYQKGQRVPYKSYGNGSAMRVSAVGWMFDTLAQTENVAKISASITHDHPEGIKGAQATAAAIFMARTGKSKDEIRDYIERTYGYNLHRTLDEIRPTYRFDGSCQGTVPEALIAFLESKDFEDSIRLAVSLGGDSDTLACINGGVAEAYYQHIPAEMAQQAIALVPTRFLDVLEGLRRKGYYVSTIASQK